MVWFGLVWFGLVGFWFGLWFGIGFGFGYGSGWRAVHVPAASPRIHHVFPRWVLKPSEKSPENVGKNAVQGPGLILGVLSFYLAHFGFISPMVWETIGEKSRNVGIP